MSRRVGAGFLWLIHRSIKRAGRHFDGVLGRIQWVDKASGRRETLAVLSQGCDRSTTHTPGPIRPNVRFQRHRRVSDLSLKLKPRVILWPMYAAVFGPIKTMSVAAQTESQSVRR